MKALFVILMITAFLLVSITAMAQNYATGGSPPLAQPLVREGTIAVRLVEVFNLGRTTNEVEAENILVANGIAPRNGWISDYPVTPDIASELRAAVTDAAGSGGLKLGRVEAAVAFDGILQGYDLAMTDDTSGGTAGREQAPVYPDSSYMDDYYYNEGPPAVTYYAPPMDYANLYSWVPYPFWSWNTWFPGFFVLSDFDRFAFAGDHVVVVSNHFFDRDDHRFRKIDAGERFNNFHGARFDNSGRHFVNSRVVGPAEVRRGAEKTFIAGHNRVRSDFERGRVNFEGSREMRAGTRETNREYRMFAASPGKTFNFSAGREGTFGLHEGSWNFSGRMERSSTPSSAGLFNSHREFTPSDGVRSDYPASGGHRGFGQSFGGVRGGSMGGGFSSFGGVGGGGHGRR